MKDSALNRVEVEICKVDSKLGLVFGFAIVCKLNGEPYYDSGSLDTNDNTVYSDHVTEQAMLEGVTDFMKSQRIATDMHERVLDADGNQVLDADGRAIPVQKGIVVHSFPLTTDIAKALGIETKMTGWLVAMAPTADVLKKFESGALKQFSIGGRTRRQKESV